MTQDLPITPPVFVTERGNVLVFVSVEAARQYLEPIDVTNSEYEAAYDSKGVQLELEVQQELGFEVVEFKPSDDGAVDPEGLRKTLAVFLEKVEEPSGSESLPQLVDVMRRFAIG